MNDCNGTRQEPNASDDLCLRGAGEGPTEQESVLRENFRPAFEYATGGVEKRRINLVSGCVGCGVLGRPCRDLGINEGLNVLLSLNGGTLRSQSARTGPRPNV